MTSKILIIGGGVTILVLVILNVSALRSLSEIRSEAQTLERTQNHLEAKYEKLHIEQQLVATELPPFHFSFLGKGESIASHAFLNQAQYSIVLVFSDTDCESCMDTELSLWKELWGDYLAQGQKKRFQIVGIGSGVSRLHLVRYAAIRGFHFPILYDSLGVYRKQLGIPDGRPGALFVDNDGIIRILHVADSRIDDKHNRPQQVVFPGCRSAMR